MKKFDLLAACEHHLVELLKLPTVTNRTELATSYVADHAQAQGYKVDVMPDNTVRVKIKGKKAEKERLIAYGGHLDRIGLMVDELCDDGTVKISSIGGLYPRHVEEFPAVLHTRNQELAGLIVHEDAPIHKVGGEKFAKREGLKWDKIRFRPDACVAEPTKKQLEKLGVLVGDLVFLDPQLRLDHEHGVMRSRWLDNTLGCAILLALMDGWKAEKTTPTYCTEFVFSVAEEAGMGGSTVLRPEVTDFIAIDTSIGEEKGVDMKNPTVLQKAGRFPYSKRLLDELDAAATKAKVSYDRQVLSGGGTDAEQARLAGFGGRIVCVSVPLKNLHAIEACTAEAVDKMLTLLDAYAH